MYESLDIPNLNCRKLELETDIEETNKMNSKYKKTMLKYLTECLDQVKAQIIKKSN